MNTAKQIHERWRRSFFTVWTGQSLSLVMSELVQFALVWWLTTTTASATVVATATALALLPKAVLGPFAGALVDRWNRRFVLIVADSVVALALLWLTYLFLLNSVQVWHVYLVAIIRAIGQSFKMSAMLASTSLMVPEANLSRVSGLNQTVRGLVLIAAPLLGTLMMSLLPFYGVVALDVGGALLALAPLCFIGIPNPEGTAGRSALRGKQSPSVWSEVCEGLQYVRDWPGAVGMLVISTSINFIARPAFTPGLIAILVVRYFGGAANQFGLMAGAIGVGMMVGGLVMGVWGGFRRPMQTSLVGVISMGLAILMIGLLPQSAFPLAVVTIFIGGVMMSLCMSPIQALIQSTAAPAMQGRVFTLMDSASIAIAPLSVWIAGPLFDHLGPQAWYIGGGLVAVLIGLVGFGRPAIINLGAPQFNAPVRSRVKTQVTHRESLQ